MEKEYDLASMKGRPNPFAQQLKQQISLPLKVVTIDARLRSGLKRVGMVEFERPLPGKAPSLERRHYLHRLPVS